jgi:DeoD family purine-nucleoside phosphorylase
VGDPGRAEMINTFLTEGKCVATNRGLLGYTGTYQGTPISVQTTGIGCPSASIVVEELIQLGAQCVIRIGTCGGIGKGIKPLDMIAALSAVPLDGATQTLVKGEPIAPHGDFSILHNAFEVAKEMKVTLLFDGVASVDIFYNPYPDYVEKLRGLGAIAVEMETSLIYYLAKKNNIKAASFLLVSDIVGKHDEEFTTYVTDEDLAKGMETLVTLVLRTATRK